MTKPGPKNGVIFTNEHKKKLKEARLILKEKNGYINSPETREKQRLARLGKPGYPQTEHGKKMISLAQKGRKHKPQQGFQKGNQWGYMGIDYKSGYPIYWTDELKSSIRIRDNNICQECGLHRDENDRELDVHHIDYNKENCNPINLITLCRNCHLKTNFNRQHWVKYFKDVQTQ